MRIFTPFSLAFALHLFAPQTGWTVEPVKTPDPLAPRYEASLTDGIDFQKPGYPNFLRGVTGVSVFEPWGRWTEGTETIFQFAKPLPKDFYLILSAKAFGPNLGVPFVIKAGAIQHTITIEGRDVETHRILFNAVKTDSITLLPAKPTSPKELGMGPDGRRLGVGLITLQVVPLR